MSYTSHGDLLGGIGSNGKGMTKESQLRDRLRNGPTPANNIVEITRISRRGDYVRLNWFLYTIRDCYVVFSLQDGPTGTMCEDKPKQLDNPFIDNGQKQTVVDMKGNFEWKTKNR